MPGYDLHEKLEALEAKIETRLKSVEVNMLAGFAQITARQDVSNAAVAKLKESDIRRDERDKTLKEVAGQIQTNTRWYVLAGVAIAGPTAVILERLL